MQVQINGLEEKRVEAVGKLKQAAEANAELQAEFAVGSTTWHKHETVDDRINDVLTLLGD